MSLEHPMTDAKAREYWRCDSCRAAGMLHCIEVEGCIRHGNMRRYLEKNDE